MFFLLQNCTDESEDQCTHTFLQSSSFLLPPRFLSSFSVAMKSETSSSDCLYMIHLWPTTASALTSVESFNSVCDSIRQSKAFLAGFFPSYAYNSILRQLRLLSQPICLKQHFIIIFFSTWVQLGFIQPERAEIAMGTLHVTHSDRWALCNPKTVVSKEFRLKFLRLSG